MPPSTRFDSAVPPLERGALVRHTHTATETAGLLRPVPPQWVSDALSGERSVGLGVDGRISATGSADLTLLATTIRDAAVMETQPLREAVADAYAAIGDVLAERELHAVRLWNYLPNPGHLMSPGLDRYMVFNAGRHDGYRRWFAGRASFGTALPTASAVGLIGDDVVVHCLASTDPGRPVENPRQRPAWRYSSRYGPMPPSFSRATVATLEGRAVLLIGGTASIVGEDSCHHGDVAAQLEETLENLGTLVAAARHSHEPAAERLTHITDLRVYVTHHENAQRICTALEERCPNAARVEVAVARLCRPELLVEIEGLADI